jgi:hypothetical protein
VVCPGDRKPREVLLRLPHPQGRKPSAVRGGSYDPIAERVKIEPFQGRAQVTLEFGVELKQAC